jgi:hypothetical protein
MVLHGGREQDYREIEKLGREITEGVEIAVPVPVSVLLHKKILKETFPFHTSNLLSKIYLNIILPFPSLSFT